MPGTPGQDTKEASRSRKMGLCGHTKTWKSVLNAKFGCTLGGEDMGSVGGKHEHGGRMRDPLAKGEGRRRGDS